METSAQTAASIWQIIYNWFPPTGWLIIVGVILVLIFILLNLLFLVWMERKVSARFQLRIGPDEVGPIGLLQIIVDAVKLISKELIRPQPASSFLYKLAPVLVFTPTVIPFIVLPFGQHFMIRDMNIAVLLVFAFGSLTVLSILMGGWASNNKYALLGAMRSVAQDVAYEIPLILAAMSVVLMTGTLSLKEIVAAQEGVWFCLYQPIGALIYLIASTAETNRAPFDIPEAESELVAGFHTEYSGMRFALFFLSEYTNMFIVASVATTLFFGGWRGPFLPGPWWFLIKVYIIIFVVMWVRYTFPRVRFDQLMNFAWKYLIPLALVNLILTALVMKLV